MEKGHGQERAVANHQARFRDMERRVKELEGQLEAAERDLNRAYEYIFDTLGPDGYAEMRGFLAEAES